MEALKLEKVENPRIYEAPMLYQFLCDLFYDIGRDGTHAGHPAQPYDRSGGCRDSGQIRGHQCRRLDQDPHGI